MLLQIIDQEINPHVDQWEAEGTFPAHKIFKILGSAGFLGVNKPVGKSDRLLTWQISLGTPESTTCIFMGLMISTLQKQSPGLTVPSLWSLAWNFPTGVIVGVCFSACIFLRCVINWQCMLGQVSSPATLKRNLGSFFLSQRQLQLILRV